MNLVHIMTITLAFLVKLIEKAMWLRILIHFASTYHLDNGSSITDSENRNEKNPVLIVTYYLQKL